MSERFFRFALVVIGTAFAGVLAFMAVGMAPQIKTSEAAVGAKAVVPAPASRPKTEIPEPQNIPEHVQAACMSKVRGMVPVGTKVNGMSVAYDHSLDRINQETTTINGHSFKSPRLVSYPTDFNFYTVTVEAEIEGRRFDSQYKCRQVGGLIEIMRG